MSKVVGIFKNICICICIFLNDLRPVDTIGKQDELVPGAEMRALASNLGVDYMINSPPARPRPPDLTNED